MPLADELRAAIGAVTVLRVGPRRASQATAVGALACYPLVGGLLGVAAGWTASLVAGLGAMPAALLATGVLMAGSGAWSVRDLARAAAPSGMASAAAVGGALAVKVWAIAAVPAPGRTVALAIAVMLGHWAVVVQCYGGRPAEPREAAGALVGRARLREFGWASALAFGTTMAVLDAIGLLVLLAATLVTVAIRVLAYRRRGGISTLTLGASLELVEIAALAVLAALAR